jgi:hypothetical protein
MTSRNPDERRSEERDEVEFIASVAGPLRAPETLDASFEQRLMSAVHAELLSRDSLPRHARASQSRWWRGRTITLSPIALLAAAAGIIAVFVAGAGAGFLTQRRDHSAKTATVAGVDTVHMVRFVFLDSAARSVSLVGDFNGWTKGVTQLLPGGQKGTWIVSVPLSLGRHEYAFIVDGQRWVADPFAMPLDDEFGTHSSVVMLGDAHG